MFGKKDRLNPSATDTLVGEGTVFEGNITSQASLRIEGKLVGDIDCVGDVIIGERGSARSNIMARNITVAGEVHGNITTMGLLTITSTGKLYGNTNCQSLVIVEGAFFQGQSIMSAGQTSPANEKTSGQQRSETVVSM